MKMLGTFELGDAERVLPDQADQPHTLAIVGNVASLVWPFFQRARRDRPDLSLDQWTREIVDDIARDLGIVALYPFEGPPYHPFMRWAERTGTLFPSPIGLTIHPVYGLWLAFRAALLIDHPLDEPKAVRRRPCDDCQDRPCLTACPVGAFTERGYDFEACLGHLDTQDNACRRGGCLARVACPVGQEYRYVGDHAAFHMTQLLKAHGRL